MHLFLEKNETITDKCLMENSGDEKININAPLSNLPEFSQQNTKESVARFINALASIKTGRDYISKLI